MTTNILSVLTMSIMLRVMYKAFGVEQENTDRKKENGTSVKSI